MENKNKHVKTKKKKNKKNISTTKIKGVGKATVLSPRLLEYC
jgi:hypothetical protein